MGSVSLTIADTILPRRDRRRQARRQRLFFRGWTLVAVAAFLPITPGGLRATLLTSLLVTAGIRLLAPRGR